MIAPAAPEPLDRDVVDVGNEVGVELRAEGRADALGEHEILDADRHAGEEAAIVAAHDARLEVAGGRARLIDGGNAEGIELRVEPLHRGDRRFGRLDRRDLARSDKARKRAGIESRRDRRSDIEYLVRGGDGAPPRGRDPPRPLGPRRIELAATCARVS